jgi:predicted nuclease with RNAse H fold
MGFLYDHVSHLKFLYRSKMRINIFGIDLSGPSNTKESTLVSFEARNNSLQMKTAIEGVTDLSIYGAIAESSANVKVIVGIDAPLSYNPGGGDRKSDKDLRKHIVAKGMPSGSVMPPTLNKMAYLTLRGISVCRFLESHPNKKISIVEVHPSGAMTLRGARVKSIRKMKSSTRAKQTLLQWLENQGLNGIDLSGSVSDHYVAACAAALAAWKWHLGESVWIFKSEMPFHPYDFAC